MNDSKSVIHMLLRILVFLDATLHIRNSALISSCIMNVRTCWQIDKGPVKKKG